MDGVLLPQHVSRSTQWRYMTPTVRRLNIALELAKHNNTYEDIASKFFEVCLLKYQIEYHEF